MLIWHSVCFDNKRFPIQHLVIDFQCRKHISLDVLRRLFSEPYRIEQMKEGYTPNRTLPLAKSLISVELAFQTGEAPGYLYVNEVVDVWNNLWEEIAGGTQHQDPAMDEFFNDTVMRTLAITVVKKNKVIRTEILDKTTDMGAFFVFWDFHRWSEEKRVAEGVQWAKHPAPLNEYDRIMRLGSWMFSISLTGGFYLVLREILRRVW